MGEQQPGKLSGAGTLYDDREPQKEVVTKKILSMSSGVRSMSRSAGGHEEGEITRQERLKSRDRDLEDRRGIRISKKEKIVGSEVLLGKERNKSLN